jgi:hypothetical protein
MYRIYEVLVLACDRQLLCHYFYILVYEVCYDLLERSFVNLSEYLLEKHQLLRKVKEFQVKGTLLTIFS